MNAKLMRKIFFIVLIEISFGQFLCAQAEVSLASPLLASEILAHTASQCRKTVDQLWEGRRSIKPEHMRDFQMTVGQASKSCDELQEIYAQVRRAARLKQSYDQALAASQKLISGQTTVPLL